MFTLLGNHNAAGRRDYMITNRESFFNDNPIDDFDFEWYPKCWIVFVYMGGASDQPAGDANPFKPRGMADKLLVETRHLEQIAEQQTAASKYQRRTVRSLKQKPVEGPTDGVVDLTTSAATTTRTVIMTHSKDSSFDRISLDEKIKQHKSMIETLQQLKAKGHAVTDEEILDAEYELLEIIRSRKKNKPSNELVVKHSITATDNNLDEVNYDDVVPSALLEEKRAAALYGGDSNAVVDILADDDDDSLEIFKV